jgi:cell division septum initiation protein DivIVA
MPDRPQDSGDGPDDVSTPRPVGARFHRRSAEAPTPQQLPGLAGVEPGAGEAVGRQRPAPHFELALRGYARSEVDRHIEELEAVIADLRVQLQREQNRREAVEAHVYALKAPLEQAAPRPTPAGPTEGPLAEKLVRLARREAAELRAAARKDAATMLEEARREVEQYRYDAHQSIMQWARALDEDIGNRPDHRSGEDQRET